MNIIISRFIITLSLIIGVFNYYQIQLNNNSVICGESYAVDNNTIVLGSCSNNLYSININVGTPTQQLKCIIDTSTNYLWLLVQQQNQQNGFNINGSSSLVFSDQYLQIQGPNYIVEGQAAQDYLSINDTAIDIQNKLMLVSGNVSVQQYYGESISGVVGLSLRSKYYNFIYNSYLSSLIDTSQFILNINQDNDNLSYLYYNQLPASILQSTYYVPVRSELYYQLLIIGLVVGSQDYTHNAPDSALISSAIPYFQLNQKIYNKIMKKYFQQCTFINYVPSCFCNMSYNWPSFQFMFEGAAVTITKDNYMTYNNTNCSIGFIPSSEHSYLVVGLSLFYEYNITFDGLSKKVGFQGGLTPIEIIDFGYFLAFCYIFLILIMCMIGLGMFVVWEWKQQQRKEVRKTKYKVTQITYYNKFIQAQ